MPCTGAPFTTSPTPTPVPTVMYAVEVREWPPGCRLACANSTMAGALTSVSKPTGTPNTSSAPTTSVLRHCTLGELVMCP